MRKYSQAVTVGSIVKHRIEEEINKRQKSPSETSQDAVAGTDVGDVQDDEEGEDIGSSAAIPAAEAISSEAEKLEMLQVLPSTDVFELVGITPPPEA